MTRTISLIIGIATVSRLFIDSASELILSAVLAGIGIALIQALMPVLDVGATFSVLGLGYDDVGQTFSNFGSLTAVQLIFRLSSPMILRVSHATFISSLVYPLSRNSSMCGIRFRSMGCA